MSLIKAVKELDKYQVIINKTTSYKGIWKLLITHSVVVYVK
jgi:hypothetical protein